MPHIAQRPVMRRSPDGGRTFPRSSPKGHRYEVAIQTRLPSRPTTVPTCDAHTGAGRLLVLDLDASRVPPQGAADRAGHITAVVERVAALIAECGGRALVDRSPSGGAHVYLLWSAPRPHGELRMLARAFARRFRPVVDTSPMESADGQIRGPGSPHKSEGGRLTGYLRLACTLEEAEAICARPCGPAVWEALHVELAAELDEVAGGTGVLEAAHPAAPAAPLDGRGEPYWARGGGRAPIRADLEEIARTGAVSSRYPSRSEARQAVLASAAARGWRLEQVRAQLTGAWAAIAGWWRDDARLRAEWDKAIAYTTPRPAKTPAGQKPGDPGRSCNTSEITYTPPLPHHRPEPSTTTFTPQTPAHAAQPATDSTPTPSPYVVKRGGWWGLEVRAAPWELTQYQQIRTWQQAMRIVERLQETEWGARALSYRAVLRAIGAAAQMAGSTTIAFGTRQLAYMTGLDHTTVARALQALRTGPHALIDLVQEAHGTRADTYQLVIPDQVAAEAAWRTWRPGRIEAIHPAFRALGLPAAFAYEALSSAEMTPRELATAALLPRSTTHEALHLLAAHGLAERSPDGGWRRGPATLDDVAAATGAADLAAAHLAEHRADRALWHAWLGTIDALTDKPTDPTDDRTRRSAHTAAGVFAQACADTPRRRTTRRRTGSHRRDRRAAPAWLVPPPRRPITESDLAPPAEVLAVLAAPHPPDTGWTDHPGPALPPDVRAAIHDDLAVITADDDHQTAEHAAYEAALAALRTQT